MIEIRKEIVNGVGNVQKSEHIAFVDCSIKTILNDAGQYYNTLAQVETKKYTLHGQDTYVRYVFELVKTLSLYEAFIYAKDKTKIAVDECNNYICQANRAYSISNKRRGIADKSLAIKEITAADLMFGGNDGKYCVVVYGEQSTITNK